MGREIRRVPADWEHPKNERGHYQPMFDRAFESRADEWIEENRAWESGEDKSRAEWEAKEGGRRYYWEWNGDPPDRASYRPDWPEETATHYQVYETVSEGTPVTPHYATKEGLIDYLVNHGDFWDQAGWDREAAEQFVKDEWAPSMIAVSSAAETRPYAPRDGNPK